MNSLIVRNLSHVSELYGLASEGVGLYPDNCASTISSFMSNFSGVINFNDALNLALHGWKEGVNELKATLDEVKASGEIITTGYDFNVSGDFFDVGLVCSGSPECWLEPVESNVVNCYKIRVDCCYSHEITQKQINNRGAAICAIVDALCSQGHLVEIEAVVYVKVIDKKRKKDLYITVPINTQPLDLDSIAFVFGHPSFLRRIIFAAIDNIMVDDVDDNYGSVGGLLPTTEKTIDFGGDNWQTFYTVSETKRWIAEQIKKLEA